MGKRLLFTTIAVVLEDVTVDADTGEGSGGSSALTEHVAATVLAAEAWLAFHQGLGLHCNRHRASVTMSHPRASVIMSHPRASVIMSHPRASVTMSHPRASVTMSHPKSPTGHQS